MLSLKQFHSGQSRLYARLDVRTEVALALSFASLLILCRVLQATFYVRGAVRCTASGWNCDNCRGEGVHGLRATRLRFSRRARALCCVTTRLARASRRIESILNGYDSETYGRTKGFGRFAPPYSGWNSADFGPVHLFGVDEGLQHRPLLPRWAGVAVFERGCCEALANCHRETFHQLIAAPVEDLVSQMEGYMASSQSRPQDFVAVWKGLEPYRVAVPVETDPFSAEFLFSNFKVALAIVEERLTEISSVDTRRIATAVTCPTISASSG